MLQQYVSKCFICFSLLLQQVFSCCKLQVFYLDVAYVFTHMLKVYIPDVSSVSDVRCIQVFHVARVSCCSESQGHRGMGRGEPVADRRGMRRVGGNGRGHDGAGVRLHGGANGWGWRRVSHRCELARRADGRPMEFIPIRRPCARFPLYILHRTENMAWLHSIILSQV